jgi:ABC-type amino acid transport system permease subunit
MTNASSAIFVHILKNIPTFIIVYYWYEKKGCSFQQEQNKLFDVFMVTYSNVLMMGGGEEETEIP